MGIKLGDSSCRSARSNSINLLFVLLNRALLFYSHTINWAMAAGITTRGGRRGTAPDQMGFTRNWSPGRIRICTAYFRGLQQDGGNDALRRESDLRQLLEEVLLEISQRE